MNSAQKVVLSVAAATFIGIAILHNPMSGYIKNTPIGIGEFDQPSENAISFSRWLQQDRCSSRKQFEIPDKRYYCDMESGKLVKNIDFFEYKTKEPLIEWFSKVRNLLSTLTGVLILATILYFIIGHKKN